MGLTILSFTSFLGKPNLENIKRYYLQNFRAPSCFNDLRRFVAELPVAEQRAFQTEISEHAKSFAMNESPLKSEESQIQVSRNFSVNPVKKANIFRTIRGHG